MSATGVTPVLNSTPQVNSLTSYDRAYKVLSMRLLDAEARGAAMQEICSVLFGIDAAHNPEHAARSMTVTSPARIR